MTKTAADIMTPSPRTIASSATVGEAAQVMRDEDVGSLPVVHQDRLVGVVTDRDIAVRVVAEGGDEDDRHVLRCLALADERGRLESIHPRHVYIQQDDREFLLEQMAQRIPPR